MMNWKGRDIQIVAFAVPYPPDYGGVIDVFYKIRALRDLGLKIHLHAWQYNQHQPHPALEELCSSVRYYPRNISTKYLQGWPYIVASRYNKSLLQNILKTGHPVLLEGLHTAWLVPHLKEANIRYGVRIHNIEWKYYQLLASQEASFARKRYFIEESIRLKQFEKLISKSVLLAISPVDEAYLKQQYPLAETKLVYPFHSCAALKILNGMGEYALFHGNLGINENERAAIWLITNVFSKLPYPLIIAGKQPSEKLKQAIGLYRHIHLVANPSACEMEQLQQQAQIHLLPNQQPTGMKLKWVNALFTARFIIAHPDMSGSGRLEAGIWSAQNAEEYIRIIQLMKDAILNYSIIDARKNFLGKAWNNTENALLVANALFFG